MILWRTAGTTSDIWQLYIEDVFGVPLTGLLFNTSGLTAYYHRSTDTTATAISLVTMTVGTFTASGFKEIDATNMPGWYQFCPPDAVLATGANSAALSLKGAVNMRDVFVEIQLTVASAASNIAAILCSQMLPRYEYVRQTVMVIP